MKLSPESLAYIISAVKTAKLVSIDSLIIEPTMVRAYDEDSNVVIFQNENVIPVSDKEDISIGLTRLNEFLNRYEIAHSLAGFNIEAQTKDGTDYIRSITMKATGFKVDYRCGNPTDIKAPRQVNDTLLYKVPLNKNAVTLLQKGSNTMKSDTVTIISNDDGVSFELVDVNNDVFSHTFSDEVEDLTNTSNTKFAHRYPIKTILALFNENPDGYFEVGSKGIIKFTVNGFNLFLLPQV